MSTAFLFPGQGSQYVGMGGAWYRASHEARTLYEQADARLGYPLSAKCLDGPAADLNRTEYTQPAIFLTSLAMWAAAQATLPAPVYVAGHSLGEFAALVVAGVLTFDAALQVVAERGQLMARAGEHAPGGMAVLLGASVEVASALCAAATESAGEPLVVANDNCPGQVVISGASAALEAAAEQSRALGIRRFRRLPISVAPHSPLMARSQAEFAELLQTIAIHPPQIPVVMNATAAPVETPEAIREALLKQLTSPVRWRESLLWMHARGVEHFIEIGPKNVLTGLVQRAVGKDVVAEALDDRSPEVA